MKKETLRRIRNMLRILKRGEIGTEIWRTGSYRQVFWGGVNTMRPKFVRNGRVKLP
jgi:hypothetical protein